MFVQIARQRGYEFATDMYGVGTVEIYAMAEKHLQSEKPAPLRDAVAEGIQQADTAVLEVPCVAGDEGKLMRLRRRGDEHVGLLSHNASCGEVWPRN